MLKNFRDKIALSGIAVLMIGVALLIFTFISAYGFLTQSLSIVASEDLVRTFGDALAPLIATCIRIMYLGVMGWIGSLLTIRGVTIIAHTPQAPKVVSQRPVTIKQKQASPQKAKSEKPKEMKPPEPQIIVIPPEQNATPQTTPTEKQQENSSRQSSAS